MREHPAKYYFTDIFRNRENLELIGAGTYHENFIFKIDNKDFVLRVPLGRQEFDMKSLPETYTLRILQRLNFDFSPRLIYASRKPLFLVLDYLRGEPLAADSDASGPIAVLNRLHSLTPPEKLNLKWTEPLSTRLRNFGRTQMSQLSQKLENIRPGLSTELIIEASNMLLSPSKEIKLVHGDPTISNFIIGFDNLIKLIDFEMTAIGDPMIDYALFLNRAFPANPSALEKVISFVSNSSKESRGACWSAADMLAYAIIDVARSAHVVAAKFYDPSSLSYNPQRGEVRLDELLLHRSLLKDTFNAL